MIRCSIMLLAELTLQVHRNFMKDRIVRFESLTNMCPVEIHVCIVINLRNKTPNKYSEL